MSRLVDRRIFLIAIIAFFVHVALQFVVIPAVSASVSPYYNQDRPSDGYYELAVNLAAGKGYRFYADTAQTLMREPGYPLLLAGLFRVFGVSFAIVKLTNIILTILTAWVTLCISDKLHRDSGFGRPWFRFIPPLLLLTYPGTLVAESRGGVEVIFGLLLALFLLTVYSAIESNRSRDYLLSGLVLGLTVLVRGTPMLLPAFLFFYLLFFVSPRLPWITVFRNIGCMITVMLIVLSPWIMRNYSLTGKVVPSASVLGVSAQAGQYIGEHQFDGKPWWLLDRLAARERDKAASDLGLRFADGSEGYYQTFYKSSDEVEFSTYLFHQVADAYRHTPLLFVRCVSQNILNFWIAGKTWTATAVNALIQAPYLLLGLIGIWQWLRSGRFRMIAPLLLCIGYLMAIHIVILAQARYSIPLIPQLSILASTGLSAVLNRISRDRTTPAFHAAPVSANPH
jgi:4-amino-4-deoxy-L-arabinose transferase-like glycosyltransferase